MTYPSQPGQPDNWPDPSWPSQGYPDPAISGSPVAYSPQSVPPGYGVPPGYAQPYPAYPMPTGRTTNGLAIAALILSLAGLATCAVTSIVGAIMGHVARRQIRERGEEGDGLALGAIISGWVITGLYAIGIVGYVVVIVMLISNADSTTSDYGYLHWGQAFSGLAALVG